MQNHGRWFCRFSTYPARYVLPQPHESKEKFIWIHVQNNVHVQSVSHGMNFDSLHLGIIRNPQSYCLILSYYPKFYCSAPGLKIPHLTSTFVHNYFILSFLCLWFSSFSTFPGPPFLIHVFFPFQVIALISLCLFSTSLLCFPPFILLKKEPWLSLSETFNLRMVEWLGSQAQRACPTISWTKAKAVSYTFLQKEKDCKKYLSF